VSSVGGYTHRIAVDPEWWKTLFDGLYLLTDAPFVCNPTLTKSEVDMLDRVLPLRPSWRILDFCGGQRRHALELAQRGYRFPVVLDYSKILLQHGRRAAAAAGLDVLFCQPARRPFHRPALTSCC
jgi:D-alanine-D-alanine ligase